MDKLIKILSQSNNEKGRVNTRNQLKDGWVCPKVTESGLPLKGFLIGKIYWKKMVTDLDPNLRTALGANTLTKLTYPVVMDKYLIRMWNKLHRYAKNNETEKYDNLSNLLCKHSKALRLLGMCHVEPDWTSKHSVSKARWWYKGIKWMLQSQEPYFQYRRVMIPKLNGELRPLSVPNLVSRATARVQYLFVQCWIHGSGLIDSKKMHGTTLGTGCGTAIRTVLSKIDKPFIYEFDVTKFFNSVNLFDLGKIWNVQTIAKADDSYNTDTTELFPGWLYRWIINTIEMGRKSLPRETLEMEHVLESQKTQNPEQLQHCEIYEYIRKNPHMNEKDNPMQAYQANARLAITDFGLPQGYAVSPILSSMALKNVLRRYDIVMYVDDGIIFSDQDIDLGRLKFDFRRATGLSLSVEKSSWIKRDGEWLKPLEFLGITICEDGSLGSRKIKASEETQAKIYKRFKKKFHDKWEFIRWLKDNQKDTNKLIAWLYDPEPDSLKQSTNRLKYDMHKESLSNKGVNLEQFLKTKSFRSETRMVSLISPYGGEVCIRDFIKPD